MRKINLFILLLIIPFIAEAQDITTILTDSIVKDSIAPIPWPLYMTNRLDSAIRQNPVMKYATLGMQVYDMTADSILYRHNDMRKMVPASNEKIITSVTAIERLGTDFQFRTILRHTGEITCDTLYFSDTLVTDSGTFVQPRIIPKRVLHGDVFAVGSFDPAFDGYDLNQMISKLLDLQIDSIDGNLYEDVGIKDTIMWNKSWLWKIHTDNPNMSPLMVNKKEGFMLQFKKELDRRKIPISGGIGTGVCPKNAVLVDEKIRTLYQLLPRLMKNSDNVYADAIFYQLAAFSYRKFRNDFDPETVINQQIRKVGFVHPSDFTLLDGSGLSHFNYLTPDLLVHFLKYVRNNPELYDIFYPILPIAGVDGTIDSRMKEGSAYSNVHAKTGTLNGVITLSGYCTAANGHELLFSIMLNNTRTSAPARNFQDDLCTILTHDETFMKPIRKPVVRRVVRRRPVRRRR